VRVAGLPLVAERRDGLLLAPRDEHRVVAEPLRPAGLLGDSPFEHPGAAELAAVRGDQDELADIAGRPVLDLLQLTQELLVRLRSFRAVAGRANARPATEGLDLESRVLAQNPRVVGAEERLPTRVLVVRLAGLGRVVVGVERLQLPVGQKRRELPQLVPVP
jgi:hypothetical protein